MPRIPRRQLPSPAWYHVICRGVERRKIVLDDLDREAWFKLFRQVEARFGWRIHAWVLLDNHFHLLIVTTQPQLSRGMQRLNGLHAMRFNRRYDRSGHLFQGRFETRVIEDEDYVYAAVRNIYENATRVGLRGWPWRGLGRSGAGDHRVRPSRQDYAFQEDDGRVQTRRAARRRHRSPERGSCRPPRRRARPVQRAGSARGPPRALRREARTPRR